MGRLYEGWVTEIYFSEVYQRGSNKSGRRKMESKCVKEIKGKKIREKLTCDGKPGKSGDLF